MKFEKIIKIAWVFIAIIALVLFCFHIQSNSIHFYKEGNNIYRLNKITGEIATWSTSSKYPHHWLVWVESWKVKGTVSKLVNKQKK